MQIGDITFDNNLILSPMAGFSDIALRYLARKYGAGLVCTEMVNAKGLRDENVRARRIIKTHEDARPFSIQIFGTDIPEIIRAAKELEPLTDIISFNCGCPAFRIKKQGCGAAMLDNPEHIYAITRALKEHIKKPIIMKIRIGNKTEIDYVELCKGIEAAGADAVIVHGRTAKQGYSGTANWESIAKIKEALTIPVIANGDITDGPSAKKCLEVTKADGLCIGRAALGDPKVFQRINEYLNNNKLIPNPSAQEKLQMFLEYARLAEPAGIPWAQILTQAQCFTKGIEGGKKVRLALTHAKSVKAIEEVMEGLTAHLKEAQNKHESAK